jgi:hypothetical protein
MTRDEWLTEVNRLMVERYGITLLDAGFDEDDIDSYYSWGDEPVKFVQWFGDKYDLVDGPDL